MAVSLLAGVVQWLACWGGCKVGLLGWLNGRLVGVAGWLDRNTGGWYRS